MRIKSPVIALLLCSSALFVCAPASADTVVAGAAITSNGAPFVSGTWPLVEYQQVYSSSLFSTLTAISGIAFSVYSNSTYDRPDSPSYTVKAYTTSSSVGGLSTDLSSNKGTLLGTFSTSGSLGNVSYVAGSSAIASAILSFTTSLINYDPSKGNLLIDITPNASNYTNLFAVSDNTGTATSRAYSYTFYSGVANNADLGGLVTTFTTIAVPGPVAGAGLPAALALMGAGLLYRRRTMRTQQTA